MQDNTVIGHERFVYALMDLMGDLGGVMEVLIFIGGLILVPYSEFSFNLALIESLYKVKTDTSKWISNREKIEEDEEEDGKEKK